MLKGKIGFDFLEDSKEILVLKFNRIEIPMNGNEIKFYFGSRHVYSMFIHDYMRAAETLSLCDIIGYIDLNFE